MGERSIKSWWRRRLPDLSAAASRFPVAVLIAGLLTFYRLNHDLARDVDARIIGALAASFLWAVSVDFYVESGARSLATRVVLWIAGIFGIALLFYFFWDIWLSPYLLFGALLILVGLSGHLALRESNATFWLFNHRLWLGALLALVGAGLFAAGLVAIIETIKLLFGLSPPAHAQEHIISISLCFVGPVSFLAFAPRSFDDPITAREESDFTMRAAAALVKFVLVPLLLVYTAILYAYAVKIAFAWELPKGTLGGMVVGYLLVGAATLWSAIRAARPAEPLVRFFWRYWVCAHGASGGAAVHRRVGRRIADYGVTEQRYLMVLIGVWALVLAILRLVRGANFDLRLVPGVLALLMFAASVGPGGAIGLSVMSQKQQLASLLTGTGILVDGKIVPRGDGLPDNPLGRDGVARAQSSSGISTPTARLICWRHGSKGRRTIRSRPARRRRRRHATSYLRSAFAPTWQTHSGVVYFTHHSDVPAVLFARQGRSCHWPGRVSNRGLNCPAPIPPADRRRSKGSASVKIELSTITAHGQARARVRPSFSTSQDAVKEIYRRGWPQRRITGRSR